MTPREWHLINRAICYLRKFQGNGKFIIDIIGITVEEKKTYSILSMTKVHIRKTVKHKTKRKSKTKRES